MRIGDGHFEDIVERRITEWQMRAKNIGEIRVPATTRITPVITLSRQLGSGGSEIAAILHERLGWDVWDRKLVEEIARSARVRAEVVESVDEHTRSEIQAIMRELLGERLGEIGYRRHLVQIFLTVAQHGNAIIIGRGANWLLRDALNIRVVATLARRTHHVAQREAITPGEARQRCIDSDHERAQFIRTLFDRGIDDPTGYDLTINTDHLQPKGAAAVILSGLQERF